MVTVKSKMEKRRELSCKQIFLWVVIVMQSAMMAITENATSPPEIINSELHIGEGWAWRSWSSWTPCSKSCGGGVSVQKRQCLPRSSESGENSSTSSSPSTLGSGLRLVVRTGECVGSARRYHECNTAPCPGVVGETADSRADQCTAYDTRPFRGRYFNWVPYVDGDSPCTLNCRPQGKQFYASLGLVADGTPCTKPGFRAICVQGVCKVVGREGVLASSGSREMRCGRRLVSGLFSRPRLPLGYSYVTTVPRGACRLNVSEMLPSDNYIALKLSNGSYIMNGEFAVSTPGTYDAAGARFLYTRIADLDAVFALGPIQHPIDIMVLYTQPNPNIKYEYLTESLPGDLDIESAAKESFELEPGTTPTPKHFRRHHGYRNHPRVLPSDNAFRHPDITMEDSAEDNMEENLVGSRRFMWKILSFTQCTRTCGGGIQIGKFRCVESSSTGSDREVSPVHCIGSPPASRRKRCGVGPCPPRWRAAAWSTCPKCGPASRKRIVGCVQDHSKGITKVSDHKCPAPKPETLEVCDIPDCDIFDATESSRELAEFPRRSRPRIQTDTFRDGPVYTVSLNSTDGDLGPEYSFSSAGGWLYTEWSECVGWCVGGGIQTRGVRCADPAGCAPRRSPDVTQSCSPQLSCEPYQGQWFTGDWSHCSSSCGGKEVRGVLCIGGSGRHLRDSACKDPRPAHERDCVTECLPSWYFSDWSQCTGPCEQGTGIQRRTVWCARGDSGVPSEECAEPKPLAQRICKTDRCTPGTKSTAATELNIESQRIARNEVTNKQDITTAVDDNQSKDCEDKLGTCALAVQARLCHYKYYTQNCCHSCRGR